MEIKADSMSEKQTIHQTILSWTIGLSSFWGMYTKTFYLIQTSNSGPDTFMKHSQET